MPRSTATQHSGICRPVAALDALVPFVAYLLLCGCGATEPYDFVPVSGQVTLDGSPLANAHVSFQPVSGQKDPGPGSSGVTDADGLYTLRAATLSKQKGAVIGKHMVTISITSADPNDDGGGGASGLPRQAGDGTLTFDVPVGGAHSADFALTSK